VPEGPGEAIELIDSKDALRIAFAHRDFVSRLADKWDTTGIYLLLDPVSGDGTWGVYVGKAANLRSRVKQHLKEKLSWNRAVLVMSDRTERFHSAETGWLEGNVHNLLAHSYYGQPSNKVNPSDDSIPVWDQPRLWGVVEGVAHTLRLLGYETAEESELVGAVRAPRPKHNLSSTTVADLFNAGLLSAGERLVSLNGQWPASAEVLEGGTIGYGGRSYSSPSAAASAVRDGGAANGWTFWGVTRDGQAVPLAILRAELPSEEQVVPK
jgi:hypothetical protein